ncbi:hypothetical protein ACFSR7_06155 [Cohnella sp. GCM10020058]|uniref:hypothetical protein n=1 Tax=Cohnella sp. GCM10020058 TaxID=3317330 RepID=UPI0036427D41
MLIPLIKGLIYLCSSILMAVGLYMLLQKRLLILNEKIRVENRIRNRAAMQKRTHLGLESKPGSTERFFRNLDYMLQATRDNYKKDITLANFLMFHGITAAILFIVVFISTSGPFFSFVVGSLYLLWIYMANLVQLRLARLDRGYQLANLTGILSASYNSSLTAPDIRKSLQLAIHDPLAAPFKNYLIDIVRIEKNYLSPAELKEAIDRFIFSIKTSFAKELGITIFKSLITRENVGGTLTRIDAKIHQNIKDIAEESEEKNSVRNLSSLHLLAFPSLLIALALVLRISKESILHYQFGTRQGQILFVISVFSIGCAWVVAQWFSKEPNDY